MEQVVTSQCPEQCRAGDALGGPAHHFTKRSPPRAGGSFRALPSRARRGRDSEHVHDVIPGGWFAAPGPPRPRLAVFRHKPPLPRVPSAPRAHAVPAADAGGRLVLWDVATSSALYSKARPDQGAVRSVAFSPDGSTALVTYTWTGLALISVDKV